MSDQPERRNAALGATFVTYKHVPTRGVMQLVFEVPDERAMQALELLGHPRMGRDRWVGLAPLSFDPYHKEQEDMSDGDKRRTAAVLKTKEPLFQRWMLGEDTATHTEDACCRALYRQLNIQSRSEIGSNPEVGRAWDALVREFQAWEGMNRE